MNGRPSARASTAGGKTAGNPRESRANDRLFRSALSACQSDIVAALSDERIMPLSLKQTVAPRRRPNGDLRTREYLTEAEVEKLMNAAEGNRHGHRDATMVLVAYRHRLRAAEVVDLRWDQVDFRTAALHVRRVKQGTPSVHPIVG
jgi:integrase